MHLCLLDIHYNKQVDFQIMKKYPTIFRQGNQIFKVIVCCNNNYGISQFVFNDRVTESLVALENNQPTSSTRAVFSSVWPIGLSGNAAQIGPQRGK